MKRNNQSTITHNGIPCEACTNGSTVHANNVHTFTPKEFTAYQVCSENCSHPINQKLEIVK